MVTKRLFYSQLIILTLLGILLGCGSSNGVRETQEEVVTETSDECSVCHGSLESPAPPRDLKESVETSSRGVGAHQTHLSGGIFSAPVKCNECHVVPKAVISEGHVDSDLPAEVTFGDLARKNKSNPFWNGSTCGNTYCHGAALSGGSNRWPIWTQVDGTQAVCGSCHGIPPESPHPENSDCKICHSEVISTGLTIHNRSLHINGVVNVDSEIPCNSCHGSSANDAPPRDVSGDANPSNRGVGAHQTHLSGGAFSAPVKCNECHRVPATVGSQGHVDSELPAEVTFGSLSKTNNANPLWDGNTCQNTYCHNPEPSNPTVGRIDSPVWTQVDGTQASCGNCHALPPAFPHPQREDCEICHSEVISTGLKIVNRSLHVDGLTSLDSDIPCNTCHGSEINSAPPMDVKGNTDTSERGVGAHQVHLIPGKLKIAISCQECHNVPTSVKSEGHIDTDLPAEVTFGELAKTCGFRPWLDNDQCVGLLKNPSWDGNTCSDTYCHNPEPSDQAVNRIDSPIWTKMDGSQTQCNSCHGYPPETASHPPPTDFIKTNCRFCHQKTVGCDQRSIRDTGKHLNGIYDFDIDNGIDDPCPVQSTDDFKNK